MIRKTRRLLTCRFGGCKILLFDVAAAAILIFTGYQIANYFFHGNARVYDARGIPKSHQGVIPTKEIAGQRENEADLKCGMKCDEGQKAFYIKTGTENVVGATVCYDGEIFISPEKGNTDRGLNAVFIDGETLMMKDVKVFDTYLEEYSLIRYMKEKEKDEDDTILILASHDEMAGSLKEGGRKWLSNFGSKLSDKLSFRDAFFMIGQKGLTQGEAIEFIEKKPKDGKYAGVIEKKGCFSVPLGPLTKLTQSEEKAKPAGKVKVGKDLPKCDLKSKCDGISVMVHSGNGDKEMPKICANGKMLMDKDLNNAGRGFNVAIIDSSTKQPKLVSRFDTYETDSIDMEFQLESMSPGDILIAVVSDDGSRKLTQNCKETLNELGSSMIQNLRFRDVWYFIGQKDIGGFTLLEQISYAGFDGDWPTPIRESVCVPKKVPSSKIPPSPKSARNLDRRNFCKNYDGYVDFCDPAHIDETLTTVELLDKSKEKDKIFKTPIVIVPGMDHNAVVRTMETTLMQPGINPKMVLVTFDESFKEFGELATLFGFRNKSLSTSESYEEQMIKAIEEAWKVFDKSDYLIVIEEELILATDFLSFMSNCLSALESDNSLHGATAWNYNGYETTSKDKSVVYRMNDFPGLAFLLPKKIYKKFMKDGMQKCCNKRAWEGWYLSEDFTPVILGPDISRVYRQPYQSMDLLNNDLTELFHKPRQTNLDGEVTVFTHTSDSYDKEIKKLLTQSANMSPKDITKCIEQKNFHPETDAISKSTVAIYYHQDQIDDYFTLRQLCKCFGLYYTKTKPPKNLYKGIIRFYYKDKHMLLVGSVSPYFKFKPKGEPVIKLVSPNSDR